MPGKLYLIPNFLQAESGLGELPASVAVAVENIRCFMVENERSARRLLKKLNAQLPVQECEFFELSEHTAFKEAKEFFRAHCAKDIGIISEAGVPCVADPGADVVRLAHEQGMEVVPLTGPSSILLALMASGLNGQNFAFNGYLPKEKEARVKKIKELEKRCRSEQQTQIFMETPYRNQALLEDLLAVCPADTQLCIAINFGAPDQSVKTRSITDWRKAAAVLPKSPALFLLGQHQ